MTFAGRADQVREARAFAGCKADGVPVLRRPDDAAEGSRGLRLVEELAARWGYERGSGQATTWFEVLRCG